MPASDVEWWFCKVRLEHCGRRAIGTLGAVLASAVLSACGGSKALSQNSRASAFTKPTPVAAVTVALDYFRALHSGRIARAMGFVAPGERQLLAAVRLGTVRDSDRAIDIRAGGAVARDGKALVIIDGIVCSSGSRLRFRGPVSHPARGSCSRNSQANSRDPLFRVLLQRNSAGHWLVDVG